MAGTNRSLIISASAGGYSNTNWYFDDTNDPPDGYGLACVQGVMNVQPGATISTTSGPNYTTNATNVAGYYTCGWDCNSNFTYGMATNQSILFHQSSGWYIMSTTDSFNGLETPGFNGDQWGFITWFSGYAFNTTSNYANTPVGAVVHVLEPGQSPVSGVENRSVYFGDWAAGWSFGFSAWNSLLGNPPPYRCAVIGDPFVAR
jgi:hypothetical protein